MLLRSGRLFSLGVLVLAGLATAVTVGMAQSPAAPPAGYEAARHHPLHNAPHIDQATDEQCLNCHQEILRRPVRQVSPAGAKAADALAWYQTLDTYTGDQQTFHQRHITSAYAKKVMNLKCNFCHLGNDPREEAMVPPDTGNRRFTLRKHVNPSTTCLRCHGSFPTKLMAGLEGDWSKIRKDFEDEETKNGCLTCHGEQFRTVRHKVNYLKAEAIETLAKKSSDVCYGCHGGRAWYRISFPYARHPWPDMPEEQPAWAKGRPVKSEARFLTEPGK